MWRTRHSLALQLCAVLRFFPPPVNRQRVAKLGWHGLARLNAAFQLAIARGVKASEDQALLRGYQYGPPIGQYQLDKNPLVDSGGVSHFGGDL